MPLPVLVTVTRPFWFIRHGETDWNREHRTMGHHDIPLNALGRQQAHTIKGTLKGLGITHIYYSPLSRTAETASIINQELQLPIFPFPLLKELMAGSLEGLIRPKTQRFKDWIKEMQPVDMEPLSDFLERVKKIVQFTTQESGLPLLVSHGGVHGGICEVLNLPHQSLNNCAPVLFSLAQDNSSQAQVQSLENLINDESLSKV